MYRGTKEIWIRRGYSPRPQNIDARTLPRETPRQKQKITKRTHFTLPNYSITTMFYVLAVRNLTKKRTHFAPDLDSPNRRCPSFQAIPTHAGVSTPTPFGVQRSMFVVRCSHSPILSQHLRHKKPVNPSQAQSSLVRPKKLFFCPTHSQSLFPHWHSSCRVLLPKQRSSYEKTNIGSRHLNRHPRRFCPRPIWPGKQSLSYRCHGQTVRR